MTDEFKFNYAIKNVNTIKTNSIFIEMKVINTSICYTIQLHKMHMDTEYKFYRPQQ